MGNLLEDASASLIAGTIDIEEYKARCQAAYAEQEQQRLARQRYKEEARARYEAQEARRLARVSQRDTRQGDDSDD